MTPINYKLYQESQLHVKDIIQAKKQGWFKICEKLKRKIIANTHGGLSEK
jgi:hypothetical protein